MNPYDYTTPPPVETEPLALGLYMAAVEAAKAEMAEDVNFEEES